MDEQRKPEKALVPSLRFEGFNDPWEQRKLGEFAALYKESIPTPSEGHYRLGVRSHGRGTFLEWVAPGKQIGETVMQKVKADNLVVNIVFAWEHAVAITSPSDEKALVSHRFPQYKFDHSVYPPFIGLLILDEVFRHHLWLSSPSGAGRNKTLRQDEMLEYKFLLPGLEEQRAVSSFFSKLDSLIALHQRKHGKLKTVKQSLLEKMFPKEGEDVPEIRFEGFTEPWEQRKFGELALLRRGLTYTPNDVVDAQQGTRVLRSSNINEDRFELSSDDVFVCEDAVNIDPVQNNDILITAANGSGRLVGKRALIKGLTDSAVHGGFMLLASTEEPDFLNAAMGAEWYRRFLHMGVAGGNGALGNLDSKALRDYDLLVPNQGERKAIGALFQKLDSLIALHQRELEILKNLKKAMLEKMFV